MSDLRIEGLSGRLNFDSPLQSRREDQSLRSGPIGPESPIAVPNDVQAPGGFADMLKQTIEDVNRDQSEADKAIRELIAGRTKNIHETMLAVERAEMSLKLMTQMRNKIVEAYKEVMRMQV